MPDSASKITILHTLTLAAAVLAGLLFLGLVLVRCHAGFDVTDEAYYLNVIFNPFLYKATATQFSFIYHPLYLLVGDVVSMRQVNLLLLVSLATLLSVAFLREMLPQHQSGLSAIAWYGMAFVLAQSVYCFFHVWLITPNYNSLNLQGMMLAVTGLLLAKKMPTRLSMLGWLLLGAGGWASAMAKPSAAVMCGIASFLYLALAGKWNWRLMLISASSALLLLFLTAWLVEGSLFSFLLRITMGAYEESAYNFGYRLNNMLRMDPLMPYLEREIVYRMMLIIAAPSAIVTWLLMAQRQRIVLVGASVLLLVSSARAAMSVTDIFPEFWLPHLHGEFYLGIVLGIVTAILLRLCQRRRFYLSRQAIALFLLLAVLPYCFAFGTNNSYWASGTLAAIFWSLALCALMCIMTPVAYRTNAILAVAVIAQFISLYIAQTSMSFPYRQEQSLRDQAELLELPQGGQLRVAPNVTRFAGELRALAEKAGYKQGDPVIDYTGHTPGIATLLGAESPGRGWHVGFVPYANDYVSAAFNRSPCERLAGAYVFGVDVNQSNLQRSLLLRHGIDWDKDLEYVGSTGPSWIGGFSKIDMLKPVRPLAEAIKACEQARAGAP